MGADVVIAGCIDCQGLRAQRLSASAIIRRVMQTQNCLVAAAEMAEAGVLIAPGVKVSGMGAKDEQEAAIEAGNLAGRVALAGNAAGWRAAVARVGASACTQVDLTSVSEKCTRRQP